MMTIPVAVLPKTLKRVPVEVVILEAVIQELQVEVHQAAAAPVAEAHQVEAAPATVVQAAAVPVAEVNLAEAAPVEAVPVAEVNLVEVAPAAENLLAVKVQNNV